MYNTRRTVTWERYAPALNGCHGRVLRSSRYSTDRSNSQSDFYGKGPLFLERVTGRRQEFTEGVPVAPPRSGASAWYRGIFLGFHSARISRS